jgi:hypothetical protein
MKFTLYIYNYMRLYTIYKFYILSYIKKREPFISTLKVESCLESGVFHEVAVLVCMECSMRFNALVAKGVT